MRSGVRPRRRRGRADAGRSPSRQRTVSDAGLRALGAPAAPRRACRRARAAPRNSKRRKISFSSERSGGCSTSVGRVDAEVEVASHRREELRAARLLRVLGDRLRPRGRQLGGVLDDALERAVLRDQLPRRLVADPGDAGDVVARVALEPDEVGDLVGPDRRSAPRRARACRPGRPRRRAASSSGRRSRSTSWNASRSVETTHVLTPASSARVASVAITSSASHPSNSRFWYPNASTIGRKCGNCSRRRSGIGRRSALYSASISLRCTGRVSHATATPRGR